MLRQQSIPDKTILKDVNKRLTRTGMGSRCRVAVTVRGGQVTLSGQMQYENQRRPIVQAVNRADGIKGVIDHMTIAPREAR
jgi:osmotically-inducible protein OsmY